ncbi:hypothetical protein CkaCkLH20_04655 [Colletotrichum karsti]|uniref:AA1-like domain-containing protein n=1 Tax=Colletotrichum karsti TaxID=1095194 RepID=A0A9P6I8T8_9PEZI|nr:uncharacterized protein CkaCkLH20_04655 [Colletotrichum karsti]KAF9878079.1 hypothetical protein CkaCkLH20_04655 [Colletotrichum karsti]
MRFFFTLALLAGLAFGAPSLPSVERRDAIMEFDKFFIGSLAPYNGNFVRFSVKPTPGASFTTCMLRDWDGGRIIPTYGRTVCSNDGENATNSITWSLQPMGTGWHFSCWWAFTSHGAVLSEVHLGPEKFANVTLPAHQGGGWLMEYVGDHYFNLTARTV